MRRLVILSVFTIAGCITAIAVMDILLAFDKNPGCGLDCPSARSTVAIYSGIVTVLAFPVLSYLLLRQGKDGFRRASVVLAAMIVIALLGAGTHYVIELHEQYRAAETARPVVADFDFMYMAIATRDVQTYTKAEESKPKAASVIPQWQRCVIDGASCDRQTVQAHMRCKAGVVYVNQADWQAFALIPRENLRGAVAMKSMNLCAPDNTPDE